MILQKLAYKEDELYSKVIDLYNQSQNDETVKKLKEVFSEYEKLHQLYADLSRNNIEALKRGLFIQWYAWAEPSYLTGIGDLNNNAKNEIVETLNAVINSGKIDKELIWMLNYYSNWDWIFESHKTFKGFDKNIVNELNNHLPGRYRQRRNEATGANGKVLELLNKI